MVELVDTLDLGSSAKALQVRFLSGVPIVCLCVEPGLIYLDFPGFFVVYSNMEDNEIYDLVQDLETIGLACPLSMYGVEDVIETTTKRETKNGTRSFLDTTNKIPYKSYSNGYIRRRPRPTQYNNRYNSFYPLNPTIRVCDLVENLGGTKKGFKIQQESFKVISNRKVLLLFTNEEDQLKALAKSIKTRRGRK